jgi:hypothetical protein
LLRSLIAAVWESFIVMRGQLEQIDLLPDEATFLVYLEKEGRIICAPGSRIRADVIEQVVTRSGPLGASFALFRRLEIHNAHIEGKVDLSDCIAFPVLFNGCLFSNPGTSLDISRSEVRDMRVQHCAAAGDIRGENSRVSGNLWFIDCVLGGSANLMLASVAGSFIVHECLMEETNDDGLSLTLDGMRVEGLFQISDCQIAGGLSIREARLGSQSVIKDSQFGSTDAWPGKLLLQKTRLESEMTIGPNVSLDRLRAEALRSDSDLILTKIRPRDRGLSLDLDRLELRGGLQIFDLIVWPISLRGASMASLQISKSRVLASGRNPDGSAISGAESTDSSYAIPADGIRVTGDVQLGPELLTIGEVRLIDGVIGGQLQYKRGGIKSGVVLNLEGIRLGSAIFLDDMDTRSVVHLAAADVGGIFIDPTNIPQVSLLRTEYRFINDENGQPPSTEIACELLARDHMVSSIVPYRRLARWYSDEQGDERASRAILIAGEKRLGQARSRGPRLLDNLWRWTVGYGYAPSRAIWPFLILVAVATIVFTLASGFTDPVAWTAGPSVLPVGSAHEVFNPFLYALSATVPFLPDFLSPWAPANPLTQVLTVIFQIVGWLLLTALVAGVANRLRRRD